MLESRSLPSVGSVALACAIALTATSHSQEASARSAGRVKHIILVIGDGMQLEHEIAASRYLYGLDYMMAWHYAPVRMPVATWDVTTYNYWASAAGAPSYDRAAFDPKFGYDLSRASAWPYPMIGALDDAYLLGKATDSASAATAWATGYKTDDGNIAWLSGDPAEGRLTTIAERLRAERGMSIGIVTTVPFNHATPAAHVSHNRSRNNYAAIAEEIIAVVKPEVVIGGGAPQVVEVEPPKVKYTSYLPQAQYETLKGSPDYVVAERRLGVDGALLLKEAASKVELAEGKKLFGLFGNASGNFESPRPKDTPRAPSIVRGAVEDPLLKDASLSALSVLSQDRDGFFLMIEQGDIDWANHDNDYARMIGCTWDLNETVKSVLDFVNRPGDAINWQNTLVIVTSDHSNSHLRIIRPLARGDLPTQVEKSPDYACPSSHCGKYVYPEGEVRYGTGGHTNELVMLSAWGWEARALTKRMGTWYPGTFILDNTQIFDAMVEATGVSLKP